MYYAQQGKPLYAALRGFGATPYPVLESTRAVQQMLNTMGASLRVDGMWGPLTEGAFRRLIGRSTTVYVVPSSAVRVGVVLPPTAGFGAMRRRYVWRLRPGMVW